MKVDVVVVNLNVQGTYNVQYKVGSCVLLCVIALHDMTTVPD